MKCERERQLGCGRSSNEAKARGNMGKRSGSGGAGDFGVRAAKGEGAVVARGG